MGKQRLQEKYLNSKRVVKAAVYLSKKDTQVQQLASINSNCDKNLIFKMAERFKQDNQDIVQGKCVQNEGNLTLTVDDKLKAQQSRYRKLLNQEFPWNSLNLRDETPVEGPAVKITTGMVPKPTNKMNTGICTEPSNIINERIKAANKEINCITSLFNHIYYKGRVPNDSHVIYHISFQR